MSSASVFLVAFPVWACNTRKAAVASLLEQHLLPLVAPTAIHAGSVAALFWAFLANALAAAQVVKDGTTSNMVPFSIFALAIFGGTTYMYVNGRHPQDYASDWRHF
ncbi:hypothetical protein BDQ12DRAFT_724202 [Crucibulum laeve]|uniref:Uncharacterized protein n=1 Tax=Crucibulum laeve TaxID=68775 RepID=A0A5C3LWH9_9AGAR|nr:hypothetical protein BDQ12DRAFT_724202 [Crucibulum laeve]